MRITLPYPPSANRYWRIMNNRMVRSNEATAYVIEVDALCREKDIVPAAGEVGVIVEVYRPWQKGDLDNFLKIALDSLQRWAYDNDKQIVEIHAYRHDDKHNPRLEIEVIEVGKE
jgi:crossover junction endodeoxyribonuclease RusA